MSRRELRHRVTGATMAVDTDIEEQLALVGGWRPITDADRVEVAEQQQAIAHGPPPRAGTGSGRGPWATYAAAHGVEVTETASREDIVEQLTAAGVPVE